MWGAAPSSSTNEVAWAPWKHRVALILGEKMSSPSRLLRGRPTAPLPTQYASDSSSSLHKNMEVDGEAVMERRNSHSSSCQCANSSTHDPAPCTSTSLESLSLESADEKVKDYLRFHKSFLEEFIFEDVPQETLERILIRKALRRNSASGITKMFPEWWLASQPSFRFRRGNCRWNPKSSV